jgi:hypothetical protein
MNVGMATNHEKFIQQRIPLGSFVLFGLIIDFNFQTNECWNGNQS